mmetsp:Transcript_3976/g.6065  ORF Transcript_3976/g.6065 Transcript_3976/m.6065 type:complete len:89 (-) Transcript_3976:317-583(-)
MFSSYMSIVLYARCRYITTLYPCKPVTVSPMDDGHFRVAVVSSNNDDKMDGQADSNGVSCDPPIVSTSQGENEDESKFRPFLLGTGYC